MLSKAWLNVLSKAWPNVLSKAWPNVLSKAWLNVLSKTWFNFCLILYGGMNFVREGEGEGEERTFH